MVGVCGVPVERIRELTRLDLERHRVSAIGRLLGVIGVAGVHRRVRRDDDMAGEGRIPASESQADASVVFGDIFHRRMRMQSCTLCCDHPAKSLQIFERMEGPLAGVAQMRRLLERPKRQSGLASDLDAELACRSDLVVEDGFFTARIEEEDAIEAPELAFDPVTIDDLLDPVDRGALAGLEAARLVELPHRQQARQGIVADRREMGRGARGHSAGDPATIQDNHR